MKYPKIHSLFKRQGASYSDEELKNLTPEQKANKHKFIEGEYSKEEFTNVKHWLLTEKIDGMNIRIHAIKPIGSLWWEISFSGRTDNAMLPPKLLSYLQEHFTQELFDSVFSEAEEVMLFGEGYGPKIQSGGYYGTEQHFCLFDVYIDRTWWMEYNVVIDMAHSLGVAHSPIIQNLERGGVMFTEEETIEYVKSKPVSPFADDEHVTEGVVARTRPMMLFRDGTPIKFKLKCKDFR